MSMVESFDTSLDFSVFSQQLKIGLQPWSYVALKLIQKKMQKGHLSQLSHDTEF